MNRKLKCLIILIMLSAMLFLACEKKTETSEKETDVSKNETSSSDEKESLKEEQIIYEQLFDINNKIKINIDITDEQLALLQQDYEKYSSMNSKSPIYRDADVSISITTAEGTDKYEFENAGIRMKGNTSQTDFYNESQGKYNLIHFKIKFPETFAGLEKLDVKWNKLDDTTYIREYYSYEFFRANGVLAPHSNLASVDVAGVHEGVFTIYEPVDKLFIEKNLPKEDWDGDLYKCGWDAVGAMLTSDMTVGIENEETGEFYNYDLKNNKKNSEHELMNNLIASLNDEDVTRDELEKYVDMEYFVKFAAVSYFVGNPDDMRYNYNNHYIYFLKSSNKAIFIPYDNDRCFGVTKEWNPSGDGMTSVNPFSTLADGARSGQKNPLFINTVDAGGFYIDEYAESLKQVSQSQWLTTEKFDSVYEIAYNNYKDAAAPDKAFGNAGWHQFKFDNELSSGLTNTNGNSSFKDYIDAKMNYYNEFIANVDEYYDYVDMNDKGSSNNNQGKPGNTGNAGNVGNGYALRGTFNNWLLDDKYIMTYDSATNTYSYTISLSSQEWLKIASNDGWSWYGYEKITGTVDEEYVSYDKEHYDIVLEAGTYLIVFDESECSIEIVRQN